MGPKKNRFVVHDGASAFSVWMWRAARLVQVALISHCFFFRVPLFPDDGENVVRSSASSIECGRRKPFGPVPAFSRRTSGAPRAHVPSMTLLMMVCHGAAVSRDAAHATISQGPTRGPNEGATSFRQEEFRASLRLPGRLDDSKQKWLDAKKAVLLKRGFGEEAAEAMSIGGSRSWTA
jgi:hypothetical protein